MAAEHARLLLVQGGATSVPFPNGRAGVLRSEAGLFWTSIGAILVP